MTCVARPFGRGKRFQRVRPFGSRAQVDRRQVLRLTTPSGAALLGRFLAAADPWRGQLLDLQREGELRIRGHAFDDGHHPVHVVAGPTIRSSVWQCVQPRIDPFCASVPESSRTSRRSSAAPPGRGFSAASDRGSQSSAGRRSPSQRARDRSRPPDADGVLSGLQPGFGKAIPAFAIGDDRGRDRGRRFPCADQHPFHRPFFSRRHLAAERDGHRGFEPRAEEQGRAPRRPRR
jgi:hypothetical protein